MTKKIYQKFALTLILLLTVAAMLGTVIQAAAADVYVLKIDYEANQCSVSVKVDGKPAVYDDAAKEYYIPKSHGSVSIQITPKVGYQLSALTDKETDKELVPSGVAGDTYEPTLIKDMHYYVTGTAKIYKIEERSAEGLGHDSVFGVKTYQYDSEEVVALPIPSLTGYTFTGWEITDGAGVKFQLSTITGDTVIFPTSSYPTVGDTLYAIPIWEGEPQPVTRYDYEFGSSIPVNYGNDEVQSETQWQEKNGTVGITGKDGNDADADLNENGTVKATFDEGGYKMYVGYYPFARYADNADYYTSLSKVKADPEANKIYRYYVPITYTLSYEGIADDSAYPKAHIYNQKTSLKDLQPQRVGYTFAGWKVYIVSGGERIDVTTKINSEVSAIKSLELDAREMCLADGNTDEKIVIEATWTPNVYNVTYDWNCDDEVVFNADKYNKITFDSVLEIVELPVRVGYHFSGWILTDADGNTAQISVEDGKTLINGAYPSDITLTAVWTAKRFTVTLDGNGADSADHTLEMEVTFDAALILPDGFKLPTRTGYTFVGYYLTDASGKTFFITVSDNGEGVLIPESQISQWKIDGDTTLVAEWSINSYLVEVKIDSENADVVISDEDGNGRYDYNEWITITVTTRNGHKLVRWDGADIEHQVTFTWRFQLGAEDFFVTGVVLPMIDVPAFEIDYVKELITTDLSVIPDGRYQILCEGQEPLDLVVRNGKVSVNGGDAQDVLVLPEAFYGKTIQIRAYGVADVSADSDWYSLTVNARPAMPEMNTPSAEIGHIYQHEETKVVIEMTNLENLERFEFACSENSDGKGLTWWNAQNGDERYFVITEDGKVMFVNLKPGTTYYVYVRVKAVEDDHAHGVENRIEVSTYSDNTLEAKKNALLDLIKDSDGEMVKILIEQAIKDANGLVSPSPTFYDELEAIYARVLAGIEFARVQDAKIAELKALQTRLIASGEFSTHNVNLINNIYEVAVQTIMSATSIDVVQIAYESGILQMKEIPVSHLTCGDMELTAKDGLEQGTVLSQDRLTNIEDLTAAVNAAIQTGKFVYGGTALTQAQVAEALKSLDVMAAYRMRLTDAANVMLDRDGSFEVRLLLPEDLRGVSGLQVAFYNDKTGELEVLDTEKDGNCLVFYSTHVGDFVILGDPTMNLTGFIVALGLILACQLVGVILLLVRRTKYVKNVRHYSAILPTVMLTVRFLPNNGVTILTVLGALVVIFQIVLIYLLLSSEVVYRYKKRGSSEEETVLVEAEDVPVMANAEEETYDEAYEEMPEEADSDAAEETFADVTEESYEDDFIEPAANPYYSLPEDEAAFDEAFSEEASDAPEEAAEEGYEEYEEYADASEEDAVPAWEYSDEEDPAEVEEDAEWSEEAAEWQYDDEPTEDAETEELLEEADGVYAEEEYSEEEYAEEEYSEEEYAEEAYSEEAYAEEEYAEDAELYDEDADVIYEGEELYDEEGSEEIYDEELSEEIYEDEVYEDEAYAEDSDEELPAEESDDAWSYDEDDETQTDDGEKA